MKTIFRVGHVIPSAARNLLFLLPFLIPYSASAQFAVSTGTPPYGSFGGGPDVINLGNNNAHLTIPVLHKAGRGQNFQFDITYDSSIWFPATVSGSTSWVSVNTWGWQGIFNNSMGYITFQEIFVTAPCNPPNDLSSDTMSIYTNWAYTEQSGTVHTFLGAVPGSVAPRSGCSQPAPPPSTLTSVATDGSGYTLSISSAGKFIYSTDGKALNLPINPAGPPQNWSKMDRNGNIINGTTAGQYYDTLNSTTQVLTQNLVYTAPSGATAQFVGKYTTLTVQTSFGCSGISEYGPFGQSLLTEIDLPDYNATTNPNSRYLFTYEPTPGHSGSVTGRLASVTLPTGGTITYSYYGGSNGIICSDGSTATLQRVVNDGTTSGTWTYARSQVSGNHWQTTVTDPVNNQTVIDFQKDSATNPATYLFYETQRRAYQGLTTGTLLQTINTCYNGASSPCTTTSIKSPISQKSAITILPGANLQSKATTLYDTHGNVTEVDEYDFGSGAPPSTPLRKTLTTYASLGNNISTMPSSIVVQDGSGNVKAKTTYAYDETGVVAPTGTTPQHNSVSGSRGNATTIKRYRDATNFLTTTATYFDTGMVKTSTDVNGAQTTFNYPDATSTCGNAFPAGVSITQPVSMTTQTTWNCVGGLSTSSTDVNSKATTTTWNDPYFWRPASTSFPDGGQTSLAYNSATSVTTTTKMTSTQNIVNTQLLDGLGRPLHGQLNSDPLGVDYVDTTYDVVGRVASVSNPYRTTSDPTYGLTSYQYDALGRSTSVTLPDGSVARNSYTDNSITSTDPAGKVRKSVYNSLGRITQVFEDPAGLNYETDYTYDTLGNLLTVNQKGGSTNSAYWRTRSFAYDWLSRITSEITPEGGTVTYGYDTNGNLATTTAPAPNQTGSATVTTTYSYDALHRLTQKSYSDGTTPTTTYGYDQQAPWGWNLSNYLGRLTSQSTSAAGATQTAAIFNYDPLGRITLYDYCTPLNCTGPNPAFHVQYTYDLAGNITSVPLDYGSNLSYTTSFAYDTVGRTTSVTSSLVDSQHPATLFTSDSSIGYYAHGALRKAALGNGLTQTAAFNNVLQPCRMNVNSSSSSLSQCTDSAPSGSVQDFTYGFNLGSSNNGNVASMAAAGAQAFNRTFVYDQLNRLSTMSAPAGPSGYVYCADEHEHCTFSGTYQVAYGANGTFVYQTFTNGTDCNNTIFGDPIVGTFKACYYNISGPTGCQGLSWTYDPWGNRTDQTVTSGTCNTFHAGVGANNRLTSPYQYDAAGNMTYDGSHYYFYDAESRLVQVDGTFGTCSTATICYAYDASGQRVRRSLSNGENTDYIFGLDGNVQSEWNSGGAWGSPGFWGEGYVYLGSIQLAHYHNGTTLFVHRDHLGSTRLQTDLSKNVQVSFDYLPFGEQIAGGSGTWYQFTGNERDPSDNLDRTLFRQYSSSLGRWTSPDTGDLATANPSNPQSWNRYAYVLNNPLAFVDPLGLDPTCPENGGISGYNGYASDGDFGMCGPDSDPGLPNAAGPQAPCQIWGVPCFSGPSNPNDTGVCQAEYQSCIWLTNGNVIGVTGGNQGYLFYRGLFVDSRTGWAWYWMPVTIDLPRPDTSETVNPYLAEISRQLAPLNKVSDCAGNAALNQIPFGSKIFNLPKEPATPASNALDAAEKVNKAAEFISENKNSARAALALNKAGLPMLSETARQGAAKVVPKLAPYVSLLKVTGYAITAATFTYETAACYNKP